MESLFWADQLADAVIRRARKEKKIVSIRSGQTPSGGKHIGNLNDPVRAYFVYKAVTEKGAKARFVNTSDDRDPLKDIPARLADLDGKWFPSEKFPELRKYSGHPLCNIPDPFGCCRSYAHHFDNLWVSGLHELGIKPERFSNDELYRKGAFDPHIETVFRKAETAGEIISKYQKTKGKDYIPFDAICPNCGVLTNVSGFNLESKTVSFVCGGKAIKKKRSEGCGWKGEVSFRQGKLQWRFEWPAQWKIFETNFEPFGKDHYAGSWQSGQEIARRVFEIEPPVPYVYEFFLVNGEKMSASQGNVYITQDILKIIEPEVFLYFYTKKPGKQRDLDLRNVHLLVDEFERVERVFFGLEEERNEKDRRNMKRMYEMSSRTIPKKPPLRIPYTFSAMISQIVPGDTLLESAVGILKRTGHIKGELSKQDRESVERRLVLAGNWARLYAPEQYRICIKDNPDPGIVKKLSPEQMECLKDLAGKLVEKDRNEKELYNLFFEISNKRNIRPQRFFEAAYLALLGKPSGPRLASLITVAGRERVAKILEKI